MIGSIFLVYCEITDLQKRDIEVKTCSAKRKRPPIKKCHKKIVLRIDFYIKIDYRRSSVMKFLNSLPPTMQVCKERLYSSFYCGVFRKQIKLLILEIQGASRPSF